MEDYIIEIICTILSLVGVLVTILASKKHSEQILYASVKPIIYAGKYEILNNNKDIDLYNFKNLDYIFEENTDKNNSSTPNEYTHSPSFIATIKNTNNGIAIIKEIKINKTSYIPNKLCIIDRECSTKLGIKITTDYTPSDIVIFVSDIYNNIYVYKCNLDGKGNFNISSDLIPKSKDDIQILTTKDDKL